MNVYNFVLQAKKQNLVMQYDRSSGLVQRETVQCSYALRLSAVADPGFPVGGAWTS